MNVMDWIPATATTLVLAGLLWLMRNLIATRLAKSVQHEFDAKLEKLRAQFRESEEVLKADLRSTETEIAALHGGALSALASRQIALDQRRLEAVDQLWSAVTALAPARVISQMMASIKFEAAAKMAQTNEKVREFIEVLGAGYDPKNLDLSGAARAQPFVTPMVWATYSALLAIAMTAVTRWTIVRSGLGPTDFTKTEVVEKLIKAVLPHQSHYVEEFGPAGYHFLLEELEEKLLREVRIMLAGAEGTTETIDQASVILQRSREVVQATQSAEKGTAGVPPEVL